MKSIILGLDLAEKTGASILNGAGRLIFSDSWRLAKNNPQERILNLSLYLEVMFEKFSPTEIAVEDVFLPSKTSRKTPIALGELRGIARLFAATHKIPIVFYPAKKVKMAITGCGNAKKEDIIRWIEEEFKVRVKDDNEADAISIAYTHFLTKKFENQIPK